MLDPKTKIIKEHGPLSLFAFLPINSLPLFFLSFLFVLILVLFLFLLNKFGAYIEKVFSVKMVQKIEEFPIELVSSIQKTVFKGFFEWIYFILL